MFPRGIVTDGLANMATAPGSTRIHFPRPGQMTPEPETSEKRSSDHLTTLGVVYVNHIGRASFTREPSSFPAGSIIVRERLLSPDAQPDVLVAMVKREKNFNRQANDWEFLTLSGDVTKIIKREKAGKCLKCHAEAARTDFVFPEDGKR
jgi:hypothetical protein